MTFSPITVFGPAAQPCALDRSSYSRRAQEKSTAEANYFYFNSSSRLAGGPASRRFWALTWVIHQITAGGVRPRHSAAGEVAGTRLRRRGRAPRFRGGSVARRRRARG